ncbi:SCO family protein [Proteobacteria bacterium 005FR1]|nr:SCO family protein [Proteobacteria bacterium 005FR1]
MKKSVMRKSAAIKLYVTIIAIVTSVGFATAKPHTDADVSAQVSFRPATGAQVPDDLVFTTEQGTDALSDLLDGRVTLLTFAWLDCTNLCGLTLNALADSTGKYRGARGRAFQVVIVSMDPTASQAKAIQHKDSLAQRYPRAKVNEWRFLTGGAEAIGSLANAAGYGFTFDERKKQFAHPAGIISLDADGRVRDFISGINYRAADIDRLVDSAYSLASAPANTNPLVLLCYDYDPSSGRYSLAIMKVLRLLAILCLVAFGAVIWRWQRKTANRP